MAFHRNSCNWCTQEVAITFWTGRRQPYHCKRLPLFYELGDDGHVVAKDPQQMICFYKLLLWIEPDMLAKIVPWNWVSSLSYATPWLDISPIKCVYCSLMYRSVPKLFGLNVLGCMSWIVTSVYCTLLTHHHHIADPLQIATPTIVQWIDTQFLVSLPHALFCPICL